ncbi:hypothetical protein E2C01_003462 [Portunus trituberculatus]|uniref:Uncharacterized protein n=1 Tax=Portunus trituberculatus TaxID=210409 RepID=A0A5B7CNW0_PORTR|nr:hypothetical protein [Portunus trituberculatus]
MQSDRGRVWEERNAARMLKRPRKPPSTVLPRVLRDEDPCLVSTVTESILPLLPDKTPVSSGSSTPLGIRQGPQEYILFILALFHHVWFEFERVSSRLFTT